MQRFVIVNMQDRRTARRTEKAEILERRLEDTIYEAQQRLQRTVERASQRVDDTKREVQRKLHKLETQAAHASAAVTQQIEQRIAELREDFAVREKQLEDVFKIAETALRSRPPSRVPD